MPGVTGCELKAMSEGSLLVDYEVLISTKAAAEQLDKPNSGFENVDLDSLLSDTGSLVGNVLTDSSFVSSVMESVNKARIAAGEPAVKAMPSDQASCDADPDCTTPFVPSAQAAPIDYASIFEETCQSNCAADEILYHEASS